MKKFICIIVAAVLCASTAVGCTASNQNNTSASSTTKTSENSLQSSNASNSSVSSLQSTMQSSSETSLPSGITQTTTGNLKYTNSVLTMSVTFPSDFCIADKDYTPQYGVFLQNKEGTATLQLESVLDNNITPDDLASYLKSQYTDSEVYITDTKDIVCKTKTTDRSGNEVMTFMKIRTKTGGYNEAAIYCKVEDKDKFEALFNKINFS